MQPVALAVKVTVASWLTLTEHKAFVQNVATNSLVILPTRIGTHSTGERILNS